MMNITELNTTEISAISGGVEQPSNTNGNLALGAHIGQFVGAYLAPIAIGFCHAAYMSKTGLDKKDESPQLTKMLTFKSWLVAGWQATSLTKAGAIYGISAVSNLAWSTIGGCIAKISGH